MNQDGIETTNGNVDTVTRKGEVTTPVGSDRGGVRSSPEKAAKAKNAKGKAAKGKAAKKVKGESAKRNGVAIEGLDPISLDAPGEAYAPAGVTPERNLGALEVGEGRWRDEVGDRGPHANRGLGLIGAGAVDNDREWTATIPDGTADATGSSSDASDNRSVTAPAAPAVRRRWWKGFGIYVLCGVVVVGALACALALALVALGNQSALSSSRTSALAVGRTDAVQLAGYDYRHLDRDFAIVAGNSTSSFRRSFTQSSDALRSTLTKYRATATASVVSAGLVSATTSRAVVLVLLEQRIANSTQKAPTTDRSQVEITLVSSGGRWLINQVTLL